MCKNSIRLDLYFFENEGLYFGVIEGFPMISKAETFKECKEKLIKAFYANSYSKRKSKKLDSITLEEIKEEGCIYWTEDHMNFNV